MFLILHQAPYSSLKFQQSHWVPDTKELPSFHKLYAVHTVTGGWKETATHHNHTAVEIKTRNGIRTGKTQHNPGQPKPYHNRRALYDTALQLTGWPFFFFKGRKIFWKKVHRHNYTTFTDGSEATFGALLAILSGLDSKVLRGRQDICYLYNLKTDVYLATKLPILDY